MRGGGTAQVGVTIFLELAEVGTRGWGKVIEVLPCGPLEIGPGDGVTGKFRHSHGRTGDLVLEAEPEPIRVTPGHLFWSVDRQARVPIGNFRRGETLQPSNGMTAELAGGWPVYAAGQVTFVNGTVTALDNTSGHYTPTGVAASFVEGVFQSAGINAAGKYRELTFP